MKRVYSLTSILIALFFVKEANAQQKTTTFSLQQCIEYGYENNPNLKSSRVAITSSEAKVGEIIATGLPQINGSANLGNNYIIPTSFLPGEFFGQPGEYVGVKFGTQYTGLASLNLEQMIFNGSYFVGLKASKTYTELAKKDLVSSEIELIAAIKKAYYSVLVNKERLTLIEKNYKRLDSLLNQTRLMYENGFAEKIDVSRIQVQVNNINNARNLGAMGLVVSTNLLKFQMGMPMNEVIELSDNLQTIEFQVLDENFKKDFNYNDRIEFKKLVINQELVELDIKNTNAQYLPSLDFYGNYGASYGTSVFSNFVAFGENWRTLGSYGLRLNVPIFDGLRKSKQVQQKRIQLKQIENSKTLTKNQIDFEQEQNSISLENSLMSLKSQTENMDLAEEVYRVTLIKYQQGVGSNIEVIDADASYKEAQTNYYAALYDALIASVELEKAYGKLLPQVKNDK